MARLPELAVDMPAAIAAGRTDFVAMGMHDAYCGAPAAATAAEGEATFAALTELLLELIREC
jgi:creatinine amidohydrolase